MVEELIGADELGPEHIGRTVELGLRARVRGELTSIDRHPRDPHRLLLVLRDDRDGPTMLTVRDSRMLRVMVQ